MAVIYTDSSGTGYDPGQLAAAWGGGDTAFAKDPLNARVRDLLGQYPSAPSAPSTPAVPAGVTNEYPANQNPKISTPGGTGSEATTFQAPSSDPRSAIANAYETYLGPGRSTSGANDINAWLGQVTAGNLSLQDVLGTIQNSPEAAAYALANKKPATTTTGGGTQSPYPNDPNASLLWNTVLSRLAQLQQPVDTTAQDAFIKAALSRVGQLDQAPFTDQQSAALLTQNMEPLTQARDSAKQQAAEQLSRRGITPDSGVFIDTMNKIDQAYERGVANVTNTLNVKGIDQATANQNAKLSILNSIVDMTNATAARQEAMNQQLIPTAATLTNYDTSTLNSLINASNTGNPDALISALTGVGNLGINNQTQLNSQSAASSAALAQLIYALMNGSAGLLH